MKKTQQPKQRTQAIERMCRYQFSEKELLEIGRKLAESQRTLAELDADKSRVMKDYASRISAQEASGGALVSCISSGYEMRKLACTVTFHSPETGLKTTRRNDTGEVLETIEMAPFEMQEELPIDAKPEPAEKSIKSEIAAALKSQPEPADMPGSVDSEPEPADLFPANASPFDMIDKIDACENSDQLAKIVRSDELPVKVRVAAERRIRKLGMALKA